MVLEVAEVEVAADSMAVASSATEAGEAGEAGAPPAVAMAETAAAARKAEAMAVAVWTAARKAAVGPRPGLEISVEKAAATVGAQVADAATAAEEGTALEMAGEALTVVALAKAAMAVAAGAAGVATVATAEVASQVEWRERPQKDLEDAPRGDAPREDEFLADAPLADALLEGACQAGARWTVSKAEMVAGTDLAAAGKVQGAHQRRTQRGDWQSWVHRPQPRRAGQRWQSRWKVFREADQLHYWLASRPCRDRP